MKYRAFLSLIPILLLAAIVLLRSPYTASNLDIVPDSVEYAIGASRLVSLGRYDISIEGKTYPPRYSPWFPLILSPAYLIGGSDPGNGIVVVTAFAMLGVAAAWFIGLNIGGPWGGLLAGLSILALPNYRHLGTRIMTDVPSCSLTLCGCALYMVLSARKWQKTETFILAGLVAAVASAMRPLLIAILLPFVIAALSFERSKRRRRLLLLAFPAGLIILSTAIYNACTFGSPWRNGYHFWCSVPYDYPRLFFSASYLPLNLRTTYGESAVLIFGILTALVAGIRWNAWPRLLPASEQPRLRLIIQFLLLGTGPLLLFHLFYFFPSSRFLLAPLALSVVFESAILGLWMRRLPEIIILPVLAVLLAGAFASRVWSATTPPIRRIRADMMAHQTPTDAVIITELDPVYLEPLLLRGTRRRVVPFGRHVEYASKLIAWRKVPDPVPPPQTPYDHRCAGLLAGGAIEAVRFVASEQIGALVGEVAKGVPVFVDGAFIHPDDTSVAAEFAKRFRLENMGQGLFRLHPR